MSNAARLITKATVSTLTPTRPEKGFDPRPAAYKAAALPLSYSGYELVGYKYILATFGLATELL